MKRLLPMIAAMVTAQAVMAQSLPATQPSAIDRQLADALVLSTRLDVLPKDIRGHVARANLLAQAALRLDPENLPAMRTLAEAGESLGNLEQSAAAMQRYVAATQGRDYAGFDQWLRYKLATLSDAQSRLEFLEQTTDAQFSPAERALSLANRAAIEEGRGDTDTAAALYHQAIALDANQPSALLALARLEGPLKPAQQATQQFAMLRGNPLAMSVIWRLAELCRASGLYPQSLKLYDYGLAVASTTGQAPAKEFRLAYLNTLLDAGEAGRAIAEFAAMEKEPSLDLQAAALLVEAHRAMGQSQEANTLVERMAKQYQPREQLESGSSDTCAELAWFYLAYRDYPGVAEKWATAARRLNSQDPTIRRIWAMAELAAGQAEPAIPVLQAVAKEDAFAAAALIDYYYANNQAAQGEKVLAEVAALPRGGDGWRYLRGAAKRHNLAIPPAEGASELADAVARFDERYFEMGRKPEAFINVAISPAAEAVNVGEPVVVRATLKNVSDLPVPLGAWGLLTPKIMLKAQLRAHNNTLATVQTPLTWIAPRYLAPGESVEQTVRLDFGRAAEALVSDPIADISISLSGLLDPVARVGDFVSSLPSVPVGTAQMMRKGLGLVDQQGYYAVLTSLSQQVQGGDEAQAMQAARVAVSLLRMSQEVQQGRLHVDDRIRANLREADLHAILRYCLQQAPRDVRCATLLAMQRLNVTNLMVTLMAPCIGDSSPLVRLLAVELLGLSRQPEHVTVLDYFSQKDSDDLVRAMAALLAPRSK